MPSSAMAPASALPRSPATSSAPFRSAGRQSKAQPTPMATVQPRAWNWQPCAHGKPNGQENARHCSRYGKQRPERSASISPEHVSNKRGSALQPASVRHLVAKHAHDRQPAPCPRCSKCSAPSHTRHELRPVCKACGSACVRSRTSVTLNTNADVHAFLQRIRLKLLAGMPIPEKFVIAECRVRTRLFRTRFPLAVGV